jgi:hypothetical protein
MMQYLINKQTENINVKIPRLNNSNKEGQRIQLSKEYEQKDKQ